VIVLSHDSFPQLIPMTYLLDTCLISETITKQPNQQVLNWLDAQLAETLYLSVITIGEIAKGI
jgi:predicted nucleic acid-binding protein